MIQKLISKIEKTHAPIVVGLDPMLNYIPKQIQEKAFKEYGETLKGAGEAIWQYNKEIIDHVYDLIPAENHRSPCTSSSVSKASSLSRRPSIIVRKKIW